MENVTFALALVLGSGFAAAKLAQFLRLPAVTGYICAGIALGPSGLDLITTDIIENKLGHFTQIALMLIAFGIGEHLEFKKLRYTVKSVGFISICESSLTFVLVGIGIFLILFFGHNPQLNWNLTDYASIALLLGAVAIATAPASTLHVIREIKASGPMTTTLMQVVVINNALAIITFGVILSLVNQFLSGPIEPALQPIFTILLGSFSEIIASLLMGVFTGLLIDFIINRLKHRSEMLIAGLSLLLLCGETARIMEFSPLLAGIAAGFIIVNRDLRDVRLFRLLNSFEPPIHVLFFALAGAHLDITSFSVAGWLGLGYFLFRAAGKYLGARLGARLTETSHAVRNNIGLALIPQAGIAIGLIFLIHEAPGLEIYTPTITTVILAGIFLSELVGPICTKHAMETAGEAVAIKGETKKKDRRVSRDICPLPWQKDDLHLVPWTWERLEQVENPAGEVLFGVSHLEAVGGLTRIATILAHNYRAVPVAVKVLPFDPSLDQIEILEETQDLFSNAIDEAFCMGYRLETLTVQSEYIANGILEAAELGKTRIILLGHPMTKGTQRLKRVVEEVAARATCPVMVVRFAGVLHTERILVALTSTRELNDLEDMITALSSIGRHKITLFYMMPPDTPENDVEEARKKLFDWTEKSTVTSAIQCQVVTTEARLESITDEAKYHDLIVMAASPSQGIKRIFFGSLAESVAQNCHKNILMVHNKKKS